MMDYPMHKIRKRFDHNATEITDAVNYLHNRSKQLLIEGYTMANLRPWYGDEGQTLGATAVFTSPEGQRFMSFYLLEQHRGNYLYKKFCRDSEMPIITIPDCEIEEYLDANDIPHRVVGEPLMWKEYKAVENFYGDTQAKRSGVYWMDHIDEGLTLLRRLNASESAMRAYCLHPLVQRDEDLAKNHSLLHRQGTMEALILAMEYRNVANGFLSPMSRHPAYKDWRNIRLSPLKDVNDMLVADKIQNRKDFLAHKEKYLNRDELDRYFKQWLSKLWNKPLDEEEYLVHADYLTYGGRRKDVVG